MMTLTFYTKDDLDTIEIDVADETYRRLAEAGLEKVSDFTERKVIIEDEEYTINVAELTDAICEKFLKFLEEQRQNELEALFSIMDNSPIIKDIREKFYYVKDITNLYKEFVSHKNLYFSYE